VAVWEEEISIPVTMFAAEEGGGWEDKEVRLPPRNKQKSPALCTKKEEEAYLCVTRSGARSNESLPPQSRGGGVSSLHQSPPAGEHWPKPCRTAGGLIYLPWWW